MKHWRLILDTELVVSESFGILRLFGYVDRDSAAGG